jgi:hypothetical protein
MKLEQRVFACEILSFAGGEGTARLLMERADAD